MAENKDSKESSDTININLSKLKKIPTHKWALATYVSAIIALILLVMMFNGSGFGGVNSTKLKPMIQDFVSTQLTPGSEVVVQDLKKQNGLYIATVSVDGDSVPIYFTTDGQFITQGSPLIPIDPNSPNNLNDYDTLEDTNPVYVDASADDDAVLGDLNAPVEIIEFSDFQCPFCERFYSESFNQIKTNYIDTGKVKLIYRDFPLTSIHPQAQKAAEAAECVRSKGGDTAFWKFHDKLFENQASLSLDNFKSWAKELGYNIDTCLDSGQMTSEVSNDEADGINYGVSGTPSFFINGKMVEGAVPYATFQQEIEAALAGN